MPSDRIYHAVMLLVVGAVVKLDKDAGALAGREFRDRLNEQMELNISGNDLLSEGERSEVKTRIAHIRELVDQYAEDLGSLDAFGDFLRNDD